MALFARTRPGTSASFWRHHHAMQTMMTQACMNHRAQTGAMMGSSAALQPAPARPAQPLPVWCPTPEQRARYQSRRASATIAAVAH